MEVPGPKEGWWLIREITGRDKGVSVLIEQPQADFTSGRPPQGKAGTDLCCFFNENRVSLAGGPDHGGDGGGVPGVETPGWGAGDGAKAGEAGVPLFAELGQG